jgi:hypothetical protein
VVQSRTIGMVRNAGVFFGDGEVVIMTIGVTTLHPWGSGSPELPPLPEVVSPLLESSSG